MPTHCMSLLLHALPPPRREPILLAGAGGSGQGAAAIEGRISFARNKARHRSLDIAVQYCAVAADGSRGQEEAGIYAMGVSED